MPRVKLTKSAIDELPTPAKDIVYWDSGCPGFGVKITPNGRKVFIVLYRTGGAGSRLRKYTIGPYGRVTLHQARVAALKVFAARAEDHSDRWEYGFSRRKEFCEREGHCMVPLTYKTEDGYSLGRWVHSQRRKKEKVDPERRRRLECLPDWSWTPQNDRWE